tara:strand:+ start:1956 stop:2309 length:354 start_codon:yes stop_codon:yes gene_type:complete
MISYSTNWMGPISRRWYEERGIPFVMKRTSGKHLPAVDYKEFLESYSCGRIDIRGVPDELFGREYGLPTMPTEEWYALSEWLNEFKSEELVPYNSLIEQFENDYGKPIRWFTEEITI